jgi:hypothetical protein
MGAPYALSSDLVSAWPAKSLEVAQYIDGQVPLLAMTQNPQTGTTYTFVAADFTKLVTLSNASPVAVTLPLEATVPWPTGTQLRLLNQGAGTVTVAGAVGVTINGSPLTLTQYKGANLIKTGTNVWTFIPFASGVGAADFSDTASGSYTGFKYKGYTSSGTLNITTAGFADLVLQGAGGAGGASGGGGGGAGERIVQTVYLPVGTYTITIGAGGAGSIAVPTAPAGRSGKGASIIGVLTAAGGGGGGLDGANGGGAAYSGSPGQSVTSFGFAGGTPGISANPLGSGCGGGSISAVGSAAASSSVAGAGGAGLATTIFGTTPSGAYVAGNYFTGGGGGGGSTTTGGAGGTGGGGGGGANLTAGTAGTANTGGGGGGGGFNFSAGQSAGGNGGSAFIGIRVAV